VQSARQEARSRRLTRAASPASVVRPLRTPRDRTPAKRQLRRQRASARQRLRSAAAPQSAAQAAAASQAARQRS
jgi:hypothetical protein